MKVKLSKRATLSAFDLEPGQTFLHNGAVYLTIPLAILQDGERVNAVKLATGTLFNFGNEIEVELFHGTLAEDELSSDPAEGL